MEKSRAASPHPLVIVQSICTTWTKASRGGTGAALRNRTPEALELPVISSPSAHNLFLLHEVEYSQQNHFQQPYVKLRQKELIDLVRYNCLQLSPAEDALAVTLEWERSEGVPRRNAFSRKTFSLQADQWCYIAYNLRVIWEDCWAYKKYVLNVGLFDPSSPRMFLETRPAHMYKDMARLW